MTGIMQLIKIILCTASFILLCTASLKINLNESERARQFPMPVIAFVYCRADLFEWDLWCDYRIGCIWS